MSLEPGTVEIDRSGEEPVISLAHPPGPFTISTLRLYAGYLATVADEAAEPEPEPEVEELIAVLSATDARWLGFEDALRVLARAVLAAGYKREAAS